MAGKGDTPRPVRWDAWDASYDRIFGARRPTEDEIEDARFEERERELERDDADDDE